VKNYFSKTFTQEEIFMIPIKAFLTGLAGVSLSMANISGKVTDTGTTPIAGAVVKLENTGWTAITGADGSFTLGANMGILPGNGKLLPNGLSARISGNLMTIMIAKPAVVEVATFDLDGKEFSNVRQAMDAGSHFLALPQRSASIYLYKIKSGNGELMLKGNSIGCASSGSAVLSQGPASNRLAKQEKVAAATNDVITVTKDGLLIYRVAVSNFDTSGIEIKMIVCAGTVTDTDGNVYQTVRFGNQEWTVENLRTTNYKDGAGIPKVTDPDVWRSTSTPAYCYINNTTNADSIKKFGAFYNWYVVDTKRLAPAGWHVPTDSEWTVMEKYLILHGYNYDGTTRDTSYNKIGKSLAAKTDWYSYNSGVGFVGNDLTMNNRSGFSALPGGYRQSGGDFYILGYSGSWWSATEFDEYYADCLYLSSDNYALEGASYLKSRGFSVRLVKDN
jgi:uncharacterized protein (TIGR02145 family)